MLWMALGVFVADRLVKGWALSALADGRVIHCLPGVFRLVYAENTGAAFGLFAATPWVGYVLTPLMLLIGYFLLRGYRLSLLPRLCAGLILGGAVGNYLDRLIYGFVIDMIDVTFMNFAVFNLADAAICAGGVGMAASLLLRPKDWRALND